MEAGRGRVSREGRSEPESVVLRRSEGGKMADRFSRFNEDRDFQVNTGVAEHPRREGLAASPGPPASGPPGLPALFPSALCSALQAGSFLPLISLGASEPEMRPRRLLHPVRFASSARVSSSLPLASRSSAGRFVGVVVGRLGGSVQAQGWPPGLGKAWGQRF